MNIIERTSHGVKSWLLTIGAHTSFLLRDDLLELQRLVNDSVAIMKADQTGIPSVKKIGTADLRRLAVGESLCCPMIERRQKQVIYVLIGQIRRTTGMCYTMKSDVVRQTFTVTRIV